MSLFFTYVSHQIPHHCHLGEVDVKVCLYGCFWRNCDGGIQFVGPFLGEPITLPIFQLVDNPNPPHIQDRSSYLHVHINGERVQ